MNRRIIIFFATLLLAACSSPEHSSNRQSELEATDSVLAQAGRNAIAQNIKPLFSIDHSRLAEDSGEVLDASKVEFYSNSKLNSQLLGNQIRAGLDLPYRIHTHFKTGEMQVRYTDAEYLKIRHGMEDSTLLNQVDMDINKLIAGLPGATAVSHVGLKKDYGIIELNSEFAFDETVERLKTTILAECDTIWFQDIDYQQEARDFNIALPRSMLLVFGAPAPGASAMREYPSIGLDTFGQKVLVYEQDNRVKVIYNDIAAFADLHYGDNAIVHKIIKFRLNGTLSSAIEH